MLQLPSLASQVMQRAYHVLTLEPVFAVPASPVYIVELPLFCVPCAAPCLFEIASPRFPKVIDTAGADCGIWLACGHKAARTRGAVLAIVVISAPFRAY